MTTIFHIYRSIAITLVVNTKCINHEHTLYTTCVEHSELVG